MNKISTIPADPVVTMAGILASMDALHLKMDERHVAAYPTRKKGEPDYLDTSVTVLGRATEALRDAISYLPATSPTGAVIQVALAGIAADNARGGFEKGLMRSDIERAERHIEAALPFLAEVLGVDLQSWLQHHRTMLLPDVLKEAYVADLATLPVAPPAEEERS